MARLPEISLRNILSSASESDAQRVQVSVEARGLDGVGRVMRLAGPDQVYVRETDGKQVKVDLARITRIGLVRQIKIIPHRETSGAAARHLGESASYVPLIPFAMTTWPLLRAFGLDAGKNAEDKGKAQLAYKGMSKAQLVASLGEPVEKYVCKNKFRDNQVWLYRTDQVLRGGRALFIDSASGKVYYTSHNTTFFKDACSPLKSKP